MKTIGLFSGVLLFSVLCLLPGVRAECFTSVSEDELQGSTTEKKPWGKLAPKFLDLVAKNFHLKFSAVQTINTTFSSARRKSKDEKPYVKKRKFNVAFIS